MAAISMIATTAMNQAPSDITTSVRATEACASATGAFVRLVFCLFDFVEAVLTNFSHQLKSGKEFFVHMHQVAFKWPNHRVVNPIFAQNGNGIGRACINSINLGFSWCELKSVRPNVAGVTHQRSPAREKHRMIVNRSMYYNCLRRSLALYQFRQLNSRRSKYSILI